MLTYRRDWRPTHGSTLIFRFYAVVFSLNVRFLSFCKMVSTTCSDSIPFPKIKTSGKSPLSDAEVTQVFDNFLFTAFHL